MGLITLKAGRERPVLRRHPWIFSGSIASVDGEPAPGETVDIHDAGGNWLARAAYSPHSQIRARIWTWDPDQEINEDFFAERVRQAFADRAGLRADPEIGAYREIHAESDLLPGLVVDRYHSFRVIQILSQGIEAHRDILLELLSKDPQIEGIFERSDVDVRSLEGLDKRCGVFWGNEPPSRLLIREYELEFLIDLIHGHKTGFYLDQRENRQRIRKWLSGDVLDAFCYSGAFTLGALDEGVRSVTCVDSSSSALSLLDANLEHNGFDSHGVKPIEEDVFTYLRQCRDSRESFDTIILDPPKFAATNAQVERAARAYKDINLLALKLLRPGGRLITFSCSGGVSLDLFQKILADAALDAGIDARVYAILDQASDHPVRLSFPEGRYLKGMVCGRLP
jgi:23S rRNA (cytosine1962-C5)-methyltransferase